MTPQEKELQLKWLSLKEEFNNTLQQHGIVGGAMAFEKQGLASGKACFGYAEKDSKKMVNENTIFHWASVTKTLTGIAIMQLQEKGLLALNEPVVKYIPELNEVYNPFSDTATITIQQVMEHSAGFRTPTWPWGGDKPWHPHEPSRWEQLAAMMPYTEILFKPGTKYSYSNLAIIFLGRIIEQLSGLDYKTYIHKNIFEPLQLQHSYFDITPPELKSQRSNNYYIKTNQLINNGPDFDTGITVSNGGWNASLTDIIKYASFLVEPQNYTVLLPASLQKMFIPQQLVEEKSDWKEEMGLTFFNINYHNQEFVGHTGSQKGFMCFLYINQALKSYCCFAINTTQLDNTSDHITREMMYGFRRKMMDLVVG